MLFSFISTLFKKLLFWKHISLLMSGILCYCMFPLFTTEYVLMMHYLAIWTTICMLHLKLDSLSSMTKIRYNCKYLSRKSYNCKYLMYTYMFQMTLLSVLTLLRKHFLFFLLAGYTLYWLDIVYENNACHGWYMLHL